MQNIFSYPLIVDELSAGEKRYNISATAEQCDCISEALQIPAIKKLNAVIYIKLSLKEHKLNVWGDVKSSLTLESVISLEKFDKNLNVNFELLFDTKMTRDEQKILEETTDNVPDIITGGKIDLADIIIEQIALNLDDHPRKHGEKFSFSPEFDPKEPIYENPFKVLEKLKKINKP